MWNSACTHTHTHTHTLSLSLSLFVDQSSIKNSALNNNGTCTRKRNLYCDRSEITDSKPAEQPHAETTQSSLPVMRTSISDKQLWNCPCWADPSPVHPIPLSVTRSSRTQYTQYCCWRSDTILVTTQVYHFHPVPAQDLSLVFPSISLLIRERTLTLSNWGEFSSENFTQDWKCLRRSWQPVSCSESVTS